MIIGKKGNQNSGVEYGDIRPGLISRRVKKKGVEGKNVGGEGAGLEMKKSWSKGSQMY